MLATLRRSLLLFLVVLCPTTPARAYEETLAELFFRYGIFSQTSGPELVVFNEWAFKAHESDLLQLRPGLGSQSPVALRGYILQTLVEVRALFASGYEPVTLTFDEVQKQQAFEKKISLTGEEIRICGLTREAEQLILEHLSQLLRKYDMCPQHAFYFGSRVMPRSELVKRDPNLAKTMPLDEKGVKKDRVRVRGLTAISDLEIMVIASSKKTFELNDLMHIKREFKSEFAKVFRDFPMSLRFLVVDENVIVENPFAYISKTYKEERGKVLSMHQFVQVAIGDSCARS